MLYPIKRKNLWEYCFVQNSFDCLDMWCLVLVVLLLAARRKPRREFLRLIGYSICSPLSSGHLPDIYFIAGIENLVPAQKHSLSGDSLLYWNHPLSLLPLPISACAEYHVMRIYHVFPLYIEWSTAVVVILPQLSSWSLLFLLRALLTIY